MKFRVAICSLIYRKVINHNSIEFSQIFSILVKMFLFSRHSVSSIITPISEQYSAREISEFNIKWPESFWFIKHVGK